MKAVRVSSPDFIRQCQPCGGDFIRCWFAHPDQPTKQVMRGYTLVDIDKRSGEFTLYFLIHEPSGPAYLWVQSFEPGDTFEASYYGSTPFDLPDPQPKGFIFIADAAGFPYVNCLARRLTDDHAIRV
ncbi:siderophore-interacting protein [Corynebacterium sp. ES2794-CONJ1]|uniref:siderophore-interacting protein n=1 Tax=unclassified Corynebacterium TaxID=2624378 RepID=UPI00216B5A50|nr:MULTISPECIES: siderophore-interacting protein [unclassified Corynebacterium]MCU9518930.1 siderophore-interacting protein [Corynebacterium sp. ES2794-CONJ1]